MPGALLSTKSQRVQPAAMPNSDDVWLSFDLKEPVTIKGMPLGDVPSRFIMFELTPAEATDLAHRLLELTGAVQPVAGRRG